ncbi:hypothetical protein PLESTB_000274400 [Pleodorina starrii]|uniref:Uncharacterized protein n=1 Tax=Pleodorina starrii TaxID=330485 RepID=A0A9W6BDB3_9CHLO|nr:hypothetical protein PLESTM_001415800 [Pleodorina starrii]GLC49675.1 hypothetical protein PLESTB_000274400 [Pleodorina starrii]
MELIGSQASKKTFGDMLRGGEKKYLASSLADCKTDRERLVKLVVLEDMHKAKPNQLGSVDNHKYDWPSRSLTKEKVALHAKLLMTMGEPSSSAAAPPSSLLLGSGIRQISGTTPQQVPAQEGAGPLERQEDGGGSPAGGSAITEIPAQPPAAVGEPPTSHVQYIAGLVLQQCRLHKAHQEAQAARGAAEQGRDEAVRQRDEAQRCLAEAVRQRDEAVRQKDEAERQRDEAVRQRDEAAEDVRSQRTASAAVAAAVGPRVRRLEEQVAQLRSERDALAARLEQLQQHLHSQQLQLQSQQQHPGQQQQQQQLAERGPMLWCNNWSLPLLLPLPLLPTDTQPQKRPRLNGQGGDADHRHSSCHGRLLPDSIACATSGSHGGGGGATTATAGTMSTGHVRVEEVEGQPVEDVDGDPAAVTAAVLCSDEEEAKRHHNAAAAVLERRGGARQRQLQRLVGEVAVMQRRQAEAQRQAEEARRLRAMQL